MAYMQVLIDGWSPHRIACGHQNPAMDPQASENQDKAGKNVQVTRSNASKGTDLFEAPTK
jgi:hypothetical protein